MPKSAGATKRFCLFGGTFDPIHVAHMQIASEALKRYQLSEIVFIPAGNPPHKNGMVVTSYEDRFRMVELACAGLEKYKPSRLEEGHKRSYTIHTLKRFRREHQGDYGLFFLIGADAFAELETWKDWNEVVLLTEFIVVSRPGVTYRVPENARVHPLENLSLPVASTSIRARLAAGEPTPEVSPAVRSYIEERRLYGWHPRTAITASQ